MFIVDDKPVGDSFSFEIHCLFFFFLFWFKLYSTAALRDLWWNRLGQAVKEERDKEPKATTIQITYHDAVQAIEYVSRRLLQNHIHNYEIEKRMATMELA